ncbi:MAG: hydroxymethylbutenyl pyrophosphate reductase, partial [Ilumatobacteraceae bacterium]|nr:hydroxymethylbutenyl pyrophosphate reductase [Ilumatobacteraceae bacterium]
MAETDRAQLCVLAPLRLEASAARRGAVASRVRRTGMGHRRSRRWAQRAAPMLAAGSPVAVVGLCGGLDPAMQPGDIVVASALRTEDGGVDIELPGAELLAAWLADAGLPVHRGPLVSARRLATGRRRATLAAGGAIAVDMESAWLAGAVRGDGPPRPLAVVRVVLDTAEQEVCSWRALRNLRLARRRLAALMPVLERWADATGPRHVLLAAPRSFCAGVERAIQIVDRALDRFQPPVYVRRQIVHNTHVVERLQGRGAVFVDEVDEVPPDAVLVLAAHGVSPQVRRDAARRRLRVIDATCPLVAKVHNEAKQFADRGFDIVLVGHADHEEVVGTTGEVPDRITVVGSAAEADALEVEHPDRVAYITQTTLAVDEVEGIVSHLRERFPSLVGPRREDICYATQN